MTKEELEKAEEIKNRLSNIGEAIGNIALEYIIELEKENTELKDMLEKLKTCENCKFDDTCLHCACSKENHVAWEMKEIE